MADKLRSMNFPAIRNLELRNNHVIIGAILTGLIPTDLGLRVKLDDGREFAVSQITNIF